MEHKIVRHKAYIYTRVSTAMQVDGFSLDAQREDIQAYAKISNIEINKAIITELSTPIKLKPIANSIKVIDIIII